jgi:hypothetical protein
MTRPAQLPLVPAREDSLLCIAISSAVLWIREINKLITRIRDNQ